jgi:23S rRNA pseudouridine1911/1915/1917 synthase
MASIGHPVVGDKTYGGRMERNVAIKAGRQMLHAFEIQFTHPVTGEPASFKAPLHSDMKEIIDFLEGKANPV